MLHYFLCTFGQTKIKQLNLVIIGLDQDIFRLDVSMNDIVGVAVQNSLHNLLEVQAGCLLREARLWLARNVLE